MPNNFTKKKGSRYVCDPDKFLYNIDTFWYNADCPDYDQVIEQYIDQFEEGRNYYANTGEHLSITLPLFDLESEFQIQGGQPPAYAYSLRSNDIAIYFSKKKHDDNMPLKIQINQFLLWEKGINKAIDLTFIILSMLGFEITQAQINRIDYAIHTDQYKFMLNDMKKFHYPNNFAKSSKPNIIQADLLEGTFETITFGSRSSKRRFMRIYNK